MSSMALKVVNSEVLKGIFKDRYDKYVAPDKTPTESLKNLLFSGDDIFRNKIRQAVIIESTETLL